MCAGVSEALNYTTQTTLLVCRNENLVIWTEKDLCALAITANVDATKVNIDFYNHAHAQPCTSTTMHMDEASRAMQTQTE